MASAIAEEKAALRRLLRRTLSDMTDRERRASDEALFARFLALPQVEGADTLFLFWGVPGREPETGRLAEELCRRGKQVGLPRMTPGRGMEVRLYQPRVPLVPAPFGILEPGEDCPLLSPRELDLALVPGLCYDRRGYRLGFGGGYYDRWLAGYPGLRIGLCRRLVLQDRLPTEPHDLRVDLVLTEDACLSPLDQEKAGRDAPLS